MTYEEALQETINAIKNAKESINKDTNSILISELDHIISVIESYM